MNEWYYSRFALRVFSIKKRLRYSTNVIRFRIYRIAWRSELSIHLWEIPYFSSQSSRGRYQTRDATRLLQYAISSEEAMNSNGGKDYDDLNKRQSSKVFMKLTVRGWDDLTLSTTTATVINQIIKQQDIYWPTTHISDSRMEFGSSCEITVEKWAGREWQRLPIIVEELIDKKRQIAVEVDLEQLVHGMKYLSITPMRVKSVSCKLDEFSDLSRSLLKLYRVTSVSTEI